MNDAKSAPFAHIPYVENPCIPPKISKSHNFGKSREIRLPFFDLNNEKWNPLNSQRITRKSLNSPPPSHESREIHAILEKSHQSLLPNCTPTFCSKIPRNSLTSQRFRAIDVKLTHFALIPTNIPVYFSDSCKTGFSTLLTRITRKFITLSYNSRNINFSTIFFY